MAPGIRGTRGNRAPANPRPGEEGGAAADTPIRSANEMHDPERTVTDFRRPGSCDPRRPADYDTTITLTPTAL